MLNKQKGLKISQIHFNKIISFLSFQYIDTTYEIILIKNKIIYINFKFKFHFKIS